MRKVVISVGILTLVVLIGVAVALNHAANRDYYFNEINKLVQQEAGYTLQKSDPLTFSLLPSPTLGASRLLITNPKAPGNQKLADIDELALSVQWLPLLRLRFIVDAELKGLKLRPEVEPDGHNNWMTEELATVTGGLPFELDKVKASAVGLVYRDLQKEEILGLDLDQFQMDFGEGTSSASLDSAGRIGNIRFFSVGSADYGSVNQKLDIKLDIGAGRAATTPVRNIKGPSTRAWIQQHAEMFPLRGTLNGAISFADKAPKGDIAFSGEGSSLDEFISLQDELSAVRHGLGPFTLAGNVRATGSDLDITALEASVDHDHLRLKLGGRIHNLLSEIGANISVDAQSIDAHQVIDLGAVRSIADTAAAYLATQPLAVRASGNIETHNGNLELSNIDVEMQHGDISAGLNGNVRFIDHGLHIDVDTTANAGNAVPLLSLLGLDDLKDLSPVQIKAAAKISGKNDRFKLTKATAEWDAAGVSATATGDIDITGTEVRFDLDSGLKISDTLVVKAKLPDMNIPDAVLEGLAVSAKARVNGTPSRFSVDDFELNAERDQRELTVRGNVSGLPGDPVTEMAFRFATIHPIELEQFSPKLKSLELVGPLDLHGTVSSRDNKIYAPDVRLKAEQTDLGFAFHIDLGLDPPRIFVVGESLQFSTKLVVAEDTAEDDAPDTDTENAADKTLLPHHPDQDPGVAFKAFTDAVAIETDWIRKLDVYLNFTAENARVGSYQVDNLLLTIDVRDGVFTLAEYEVVLNDKPVSFKAIVDSNPDPPAYWVTGDIEGDSIEVLLNLEENVFVGGQLHGNLNLLSEGDTLGSVIENLEGDILLTMGPLDIKSRALSLFSSDMLISIMRGVFGSRKDRTTSSYKCAVLGIDVDSGVGQIRRSFAMEGGGYNLGGKGEVDLNTGYVDLSVFPKATKGLGTSLATVIGGFKISGHMATPKFGVSGGLATALVTGYALTPTAAVAASNPVTATVLVTGIFAKGIFDRLTASRYTCAKTLGRIERNRNRQHKRIQLSPKMQ